VLVPVTLLCRYRPYIMIERKAGFAVLAGVVDEDSSLLG
jgi:hypothetical protein